MDSFQSRLPTWKAKNLSFAGRVTLIKSVLRSLPLYFFSLYRAPTHVIDSLEGIMLKFLWSGNDDKNKIHWIKWDRMIKSKQNGGLGIGSLKLANMALLCKWFWRLKTEPNGLWARVILAFHGNTRSNPFIPLNRSSHGVWKNICNTQNDLFINNVVLQDILKCPSSPQDNWSWAADPSGVFTSSSIRLMIENNGEEYENGAFLWNNLVPGKVNISGWRASIGRLPTLVEISRRNVEVQSTVCPLCGSFDESVDHVLVNCVISRMVWCQIWLWCKVPILNPTDIYSILEFSATQYSDKWSNRILEAISVITLWCIWKSRNEKVFNNKAVSPYRIVENIKAMASLWIKNRMNRRDFDWSNWKNPVDVV